MIFSRFFVLTLLFFQHLLTLLIFSQSNCLNVPIYHFFKKSLLYIIIQRFDCLFIYLIPGRCANLSDRDEVWLALWWRVLELGWAVLLSLPAADDDQLGADLPCVVLAAQGENGEKAKPLLFRKICRKQEGV